MQELYRLGDEVGAVEVRLDHDDLDHLYQAQTAIQQALESLNQRRVATDGPDSELKVYTWQERNRDQLQILFVETPNSRP